MEHVFERFYRGTASRRMGTPGTGLGLSICKEILNRHKGRISVHSRAGEGKHIHHLAAAPRDPAPGRMGFDHRLRRCQAGRLPHARLARKALHTASPHG